MVIAKDEIDQFAVFSRGIALPLVQRNEMEVVSRKVVPPSSNLVCVDALVDVTGPQHSTP